MPNAVMGSTKIAWRARDPQVFDRSKKRDSDSPELIVKPTIIPEAIPDAAEGGLGHHRYEGKRRN
jgi:hypothetical protein